jgi:acyl carrier protein
MAIEEEFGIKFTNDDFPSMRTVADVIACIEGK